MKKFYKLFLIVPIALILIGACLFSANQIAEHATAAPLEASAVTINFITKAGVTTTQYSYVQDVRPYAYGDCYLTMGWQAASAITQAVVVTLQHAAVPGYWLDYDTPIQAISSPYVINSLVYSGLGVVRGNYARAIVTPLTSTERITYALNCVVR